MVRKTKEEALVTRNRLLDAAEQLFHEHGVSSTSLQQIAAATGVTRGAIYWHFKDKGDLFNAMMERVCLPMEESFPLLEESAAPLIALREHLASLFVRVADDPQMQRVFSIATHKIEYVDEMIAVRDRHLTGRSDYLQILERMLKAAQQRGEIAAGPAARSIAIGVHALLDGLIQNWMLDPAAFDLAAVGRETVDLYLAGLAAAA